MFPVSSEESPLKELMKRKQQREREMWVWRGGTGPLLGEGTGLHYSVILLKEPLRDRPREAGRKEGQWNVTTEKCH